MKKTALPLILFLAVLSTAALGQNQPFNPKHAHYLWPTEASNYLTSTFGETRSAHFHAALDIKTWGQRGYEVYATRDGIVDRIAIGPNGYGKVVYLKHPDGSSSIYDHLLSFNKELQQIADSLRFASDYQFEIDRSVGWKNIKVEQGDIIGYSGASGIGPPHLHFELRTPSGKPFNPLLTNLKVKDTISPQIQALSIEPLSAWTSIEGNNGIYKQRVWGKKEHYDFGTIQVTGPIGLGINAFDQSNRVYNSYAVYELSMSVDGQELFKSRVDSFSYNETDQMFIDRVYTLLENEGDGYQRLYTADGNTLPFYSKDRGKLNLKPGIHKVTIRTSDYYGNTTTAALKLDVKTPKTEYANTGTLQFSTKSNSAPPHRWNWFQNWVMLSEEQFGKLTIGTQDTSSFIRHDNGIAVSLAQSDNLYLDIPGMSPVNIERIRPDDWNIISSADYQNFAIFPKATVYDTVSIGLSVKNLGKNSITLDTFPEVYPLNGTYSFYIERKPELQDTAKLSFYKYDREDKEWALIPTDFRKNFIVGKAESLGSFALKRDTAPPQLSNVQLVKRPDDQWLVMVDVQDNLSGIDYARTKMWVNGVRGIAEFKPEDDRFVYYHPNFQPSNTLKVEIKTYDKAGNRINEVFRIKTSSKK